MSDVNSTVHNRNHCARSCQSSIILDILAGKNEVIGIEGPRIETDNIHGTGCALSAALAALMTRYGVPESTRRARAYLTDALIGSSQLSVGKGKGPVHHFHALWNPSA